MPIIAFVVYYNVLEDNNIQNKTVKNNTATSTSITGLMKGTEYQVRVVSSNKVGPSISSNTIQKRTDIDRELQKWNSHVCVFTCTSFYMFHVFVHL